MKKLFSKLTSATLALVLGVGALGLPLNAASANDAVDETPVETVDPGTFHMAEGASVRAGSQEGKPAGIRFRVELGEDMVNTVQSAHDFGFLIFPHVYLETAVTNVTGGTAASYHVKADQNGDGEVSDAEYSANTYGLYDYVEVKKSEIADWNWDNAIYVDDIDGKTYVNGVLGEVKAENVGLQFAA
ncbi:MAG: hypothetical protein J6B56_03695, partial [Clostridia bacterium]|nr:hypothetical protein [Clostridia bacterium]